MDKSYKTRKQNVTGHRNQRIGIPIGIHDKNGAEICSGDTIVWGDETCIVLWHTLYAEWWALICRSNMKSGDIYDSDSYYKGYPLKMDDGARMNIEKIKSA